MQDWTSGYVADIGYTYGYYGEFNPLALKMIMTASGKVFPEISHACELGFGQGLSINIYASATNISWSGTDFNPSQAGFAQELAKVSGNNAQLFDESFSQYCARTDLPNFDYIALHGIWSWISDENRSAIVDFINRKLKVGGIVYISYNTQPGWASMMPIRDLMAMHAHKVGDRTKGITQRIDGAIEFARKLFATDPLYIKAIPRVVEELETLSKHNRNYLAHEYFNQDWQPMPFSKVAEWLVPAKIEFSNSASFFDQVDVVNLTAEQQAFLAQIEEPVIKQMTRDLITANRFRKDIWVKGSRNLSPIEAVESLRKQKVILIKNTADVHLKANGLVGEITLSERVYLPILEALSDYQVKTIGQLEEILASKGIVFIQLIQAVMIFSGMGVLVAAQDDSIISKAKKICDKLNDAIINKSRSSSDIHYLASPVSGGGTIVDRISQLFILGLRQNKKTSQELAQFVWDILSSQGQKLIKEGQTIELPEDNLAQLNEHSRLFLDKQLPILKALQIA
jgi:SAM-dependent methyltransferase